ncbi:MAG TPA: RDD family protein [Pyrinomonadaceae bacterium]|nr:RDD family protein [Pyrinomonadaceae bacterium]
MSAKVDARPNQIKRRVEVVVGFRPDELAAPFILRCGAVLIDYIVFLVLPVGALLLGRYMGNDGSRLVGGSLSETGWLIGLLIALSNNVFLPVIAGQSVGKMLTGLKIVRSDGSHPRFVSLALRQTLGYFLVFFTLGLGFVLAAFNRSGRSLHDYLFGTVVIFANRRYKESK